MIITWLGHSCFKIQDKVGPDGVTVVTDPFDKTIGLKPPSFEADIVTVSHDTPGHNHVKAVKGDPYIISGPGEYEVGGIFITGLQTDRKRKNDTARIVNTLYLIEYDGINIAHLGDMVQVPTQTEVESLGPVHIALVPVGGNGALNAAKASNAISLFEPNVVIPMHYATPDSTAKLDPIGKFLKEMGLSTVETVESFKVTNPDALPEETQVVILDYPHK